MFRVTGAFRGVAYDLTVHDEEPRLTGTPRIVAFLEGREGEEFLATPTGPAYTLSLSDDASILAALAAETIITETSGDDVPVITPPHVTDPESGVDDG